MTGNYWIARDARELEARLEFFRQKCVEQNVWPICWSAKKYTSPRSMDQNALYWVWVTEFAQHLTGKAKISESDKTDMAYTLQRHCYAATGWEWLMETPADLMTGKPGKPQRRSTTKFAKGEMSMYMEWIQVAAADRGLILESIGEYAELREAQIA